MRRSPPLAPGAPPHDHTIYIVLDDFGELGRAYRETDETEANERTTIENFLTGQYGRPVSVVAFNTDDHSSWDVSEDIAHAVAERASSEDRELSEGTRMFLEAYLSHVALPHREK
jgi:hypothetical protein